MNPLLQAKSLGQSLWLDNLSRDLLDHTQTINLHQFIQEDGIVGLTSNPAIFYQAISKSPRYADDLAQLKHSQLTPEERLETLIIPDIQAACDIFLPHYQANQPLQGLVSLEVSPSLAHDCAGTVAAAQRLWLKVNRPNLMIKVPATPAGIQAISLIIAAGIHVNVTLLFSQAQVEAVLAAYQIGLTLRQQAGQSIQGITSVASLFLSRIDTAIDAQLEKIGTDAALALRGQVAIANARHCYQLAATYFNRPTFQALQQHGAQAQYLLFASTGVKNSRYIDTLYVESLLLPNSVNTLPDATLHAFKNHGIAKVLSDTETEDTQVLHALSQLGIDLNAVGEQLQKEGLQLFSDAEHKLLALVA
jgi:transaldolase